MNVREVCVLIPFRGGQHGGYLVDSDFLRSVSTELLSNPVGVKFPSLIYLHLITELYDSRLLE